MADDLPKFRLEALEDLDSMELLEALTPDNRAWFLRNKSLVLATLQQDGLPERRSAPAAATTPPSRKT